MECGKRGEVRWVKGEVSREERCGERRKGRTGQRRGREKGRNEGRKKKGKRGMME